jgi:hypothetical protein
MAAGDDGRDARKALYQRGVAFLHGARDLPELTDAQIDRIERRLRDADPGTRRLTGHPVHPRRWASALVALAIALAAGAALAVAGHDLARLPVIGRLFGARGGHAAPRTRAAGAGGDAAPRGAEGAPAAAGSNGAPALAPGAPGIIEMPVETRSPARAARSAAPVVVAARAGVAAGTAPGASRTRSSGRAAPAAEPTPAPSRPPLRGASTPEPPAAAAPPAATEPPESPIVAESRSFASALARWHRDHHANAALDALDAHERSFPHGDIHLEAQLLRAEILLAQGRDREGLAILDPLDLAGLPRARELRAVRGELRVKLGRCADGRADLALVLAGGLSDPLAQRARAALDGCP